MFDVGFQELALIFGVSLVVLGPKRLPGLVTKVGRWVGKARSMARDFQQQLENEVNLEELQKMTEVHTRAAPGTMPAPPPEFTGAPPDTSTYPYSAPDSSTADSSGTSETSAESSSAESPSLDSPQTEDTYSHAHAAGDAPMADVSGPVAAESEYRDEPLQADLDLSTPDDDSHLPPDDARRNS